MKAIHQATAALALALPLFLAISCQPQGETAAGTGTEVVLDSDSADEESSCCAEDAPAATGGLPDTSLYNLESVWTDQAKTEHPLSDFRGKVTVTAMIFTHCEYACPRIIADLKSIEAQISKKDLPNVQWLLLSMDSDRDLPDVLKDYAERNHLDTDRWTLLHGDDSAVREIAATLGVRYIKDPKGNYSHSNLITLLDKEGRIAHQLEGLGADTQATVVAIQLELSK